MKQIHLKVVVYIIGIFVVFTYANSCGQSEYQSSTGECCPMCSAGQVVLRDCTDLISTTCIPCKRGTYMSEPNGLNDCFACKTCDNGLFISNECTTSMDTVCGVMEGYYCKEFSKRECSHALPYSVCAPGQQIKSPGTKTSDVVCEDCAQGFYSPNGITCHQWTDCSNEDKIQEKDGSSVSDVQCKSKWRGRNGLIPVAIICLCSSIAAILLKLGKSQAAHTGATPNIHSPVEEESGHFTSFPEENQEEG